MFNHSCITLLADGGCLTDATLRFFLRLVRDYDLTAWKILDPKRLAKDSVEVRHAMTELVKTGCLETGPLFRGKPTFRIPPAYLLRGRDMENWLQDIEARRQRETLAPAAGLAGRPAKPQARNVRIPQSKPSPSG